MFVLLLWNSDSVLFCAKETLKFTARFIKTVCTFISFKEAALAVIWCWFCLALLRKVKWIWEPFRVALEFIQTFHVRIPFHNSLLSFTSFLKTFYNFVSFCAGGFCLLWCHWLLILKEGREQRWNKLLIFWISQMLFSGVWKFKALILREQRCRRGAVRLPEAVTSLWHPGCLSAAASCCLKCGFCLLGAVQPSVEHRISRELQMELATLTMWSFDFFFFFFEDQFSKEDSSVL